MPSLYLITLISVFSVGFAQLQDVDFDGISDAADFCPQIPYRSESGCPVFIPREGAEKKDNQVQAIWKSTRSDLRLREKTEIKIGDMFWAIIQDSQTGEGYSKSAKMEVRH